ncbi:hypothetical protein ACOME3_004076 [Neoechinorhynchus agilis]
MSKYALKPIHLLVFIRDRLHEKSIIDEGESTKYIPVKDIREYCRKHKIDETEICDMLQRIKRCPKISVSKRGGLSSCLRILMDYQHGRVRPNEWKQFVQKLDEFNLRTLCCRHSKADIINVGGIGPKTAQWLYEKGITDLSKLVAIYQEDKFEIKKLLSNCPHVNKIRLSKIIGWLKAYVESH